MSACIPVWQVTQHEVAGHQKLERASFQAMQLEIAGHGTEVVSRQNGLAVRRSLLHHGAVANLAAPTVATNANCTLKARNRSPARLETVVVAATRASTEASVDGAPGIATRRIWMAVTRGAAAMQQGTSRCAGPCLSCQKAHGAICLLTGGTEKELCKIGSNIRKRMRLEVECLATVRTLGVQAR